MNSQSKLSIHRSVTGANLLLSATDSEGTHTLATVRAGNTEVEQMCHNIVEHWNATRNSPSLFFTVPRKSCKVFAEVTTFGNAVYRLPFTVCGYDYLMEWVDTLGTYRNCMLGMVEDGKFVPMLYTNQADSSDEFFTFNSTHISTEHRN